MIASAWRLAWRLPSLPRVITRSTQRLSSLALGSVVCIFSSRKREVTILRIIAQRWLELRLSFLPELRCRILGGLFLVGAPSALDLLPRGKMVDLHAEFETHFAQDFFDFIERLVTEIFGFEHLLLRLLHQLANVFDISIL